MASGEDLLLIWFLKNIIRTPCVLHHQGGQCSHQIEASTKLATLTEEEE